MLLHYTKTFFLIIFLERRGDEKKREVIGDEAKKKKEIEKKMKIGSLFFLSTISIRGSNIA